MTVRAAVAGDIPALLALVRRYWDFEGIDGFDALRIELLLKELTPGGPRGEILVSEAAGQLEGYLALVYVLSLEHRGLMAEIDELFVLPEARGRGTGSALLAAAEARLRARGCVRAQLQLALANQAGRAFYTRHGYGARAGYALLDKPL
ncbi:MAG TPA: GNAT family N-acetyltransferase [Steroidobacteraceae bacterium]|nr:GNAT family N-acetyltransferase [Steroidobacteraceae bacterium]